MTHVLIADEMHPSIIYMLEKIGLTPDYQPFITRNEIKEVLKHYVGLIIRSKTFIDAEILGSATKLQFIGRSGAGLDLIDIQEVEKRNIQIFHAGEGNRVAVSEHVLAMILCLFNKINTADNQIRKGIWNREHNRGIELGTKTIGIIGYGNNGSETAKKFKGFGCKVLAYDKYKSNFSDEFAKESTMQEIFENADILSLHIPLTALTNKLVNLDFINKFRKSIYLINAARGEIVLLSDLVISLENNKVLGACLDVLENEKIKQLTEKNDKTFFYLINSDKVILTPHVAGWTHESYVSLNEVLVEKIKASLNLKT